MEAPAEPTTRGSRLWTYIVEMYPLHINVPYSFLSFFGFYFLLQAAYGGETLKLTLHSLLGTFTLAAFTLLLRIFDEFKDYEHDVKLFPHRPLPSGRVLPGDLKGLGWVLVGFMLVLNLFQGQAVMGFALLMAYGLLTYKYFFLPDIHRRSLLLTLVTHNPLALFTHIYIVSVYSMEYGQPADWRPVWLGIAMFWLLVFSWETSRKIRTQEEEDDYVTYSQIFGTRRSALVPMAGLTASFVLTYDFYQRLDLPFWFLWAMGLAFGYAMFGFVRWLMVQTPQTSKLRPFVESYSLALYVALLAALIARFGLVWSL